MVPRGVIAVTVLVVVLLPLLQPRGNGFAVSVLCAFLAIGLLALVAKFATTKPRNRHRRRH